LELKSTIEELLSQGTSDLEISKALKSYIQDYFNNLDTLFEKYQGKEFLVRHTRYIDSIITAIYKVAIRKLFGIYAPLSNNIPLTLVALGSYGREQLAPHSDIDLMIVYENVPGYNVQEIIEKILYIIWDANLKLGHRVHEIKELTEVAKSDITIKTALMESRFICGSKFLWFKAEGAITEIRKSDLKEFIFTKIEEAKRRRAKYPLAMEPHIKEGVGGLRDSNLLFWIANAVYGIKSLKELSGTLFSDEEYKEYRIALEWLFKVRVALHIAAQKKEDRLLLQYIPDVSKLLAIKGKNDFKKQQNLVNKTLRAMHTIDTFAQIFSKKIMRPYLFEPRNLKFLRKNRIAPKVYKCDEKLYASYYVQPYAIKQLLEIILNNSFTKVDPSFLHFAKMAKSSKTISKSNAKLIKRLYYKQDLYPVLKLLYDADLLPHIVPPLKKVMFMPQFDGYHRFPVVLHSLECVKALENIKEPLIQELWEGLTQDERAMLKLVVLLHDSGKGRKQRHHEVGAKLFRVYAQKLGFEPHLVEKGALLIRHHTDMTSTAYNKDIHNEKVVLSFIAPLKDKKSLDMLYILTYADVNGVGRDVYTPYNAKLLKDLYYASLEALEHKAIIDEVAKRLKKEQALKKSKTFTQLPRLLQRKILSIESNLFFIKHTIAEIIAISKKAYEVERYDYKIKNEPYLTIEIIRSIPLNLGFLLGKLSFLDIASMEVFKLFDGKKYFRIEFRERLEESDITFIKEVIEESFNMEAKINLKKPIIEKENIKVDCDHSKTYAQIEITARDQKGLLAYIAKVFDDFGIDIATAKVHTIRYRAHDLFLIEKDAGVCEKIEQIIQKLSGA
jgi:[protein-PII] uridylyltransferase